MARIVPITAWPRIDPGKKRHKIQIQGQGDTQDSVGQPAGSWNPILNCDAAIDSFTAGEQFQGGFVSQVVHKIWIDWPRRTSVTAKMRVVVHPMFGDKASVYLIQAVENVQQRNLVMVLTCLEIDNEKVADQ